MARALLVGAKNSPPAARGASLIGLAESQTQGFPFWLVSERGGPALLTQWGMATQSAR